jgi:hypothetical protein
MEMSSVLLLLIENEVVENEVVWKIEVVENEVVKERRLPSVGSG